MTVMMHGIVPSGCDISSIKVRRAKAVSVFVWHTYSRRCLCLSGTRIADVCNKLDA